MTVPAVDPRALDAFDTAVQRARSGDRDALSELFRAFHPRLLRYLRAREPRLADDLASETWLAVAQRIEDFEGDVSAFSAWLFTIARHRLADGRRTAARRRTDPVARVGESPARHSVEDAAVDNVSAAAAVESIVRALSPDQAEVMLLRVLGDLSIEQVATVMGRDANWVGVTQHRAMKRLSDRVAPRMAVTS